MSTSSLRMWAVLLWSLCSLAAALDLVSDNKDARGFFGDTRGFFGRSETMYRSNVLPRFGGKAPESNFNRVLFNKVDTLGLDNKEAQELSKRLKGTYLPQKARKRLSSPKKETPKKIPASTVPGAFPSFAEEFSFKGFSGSPELSSSFREDQRVPRRATKPARGDGQRSLFPKNKRGIGIRSQEHEYSFDEIQKIRPQLFTRDPYLSRGEERLEPTVGFQPPPDGYVPPVGPYKTYEDEGPSKEYYSDDDDAYEYEDDAIETYDPLPEGGYTPYYEEETYEEQLPPSKEYQVIPYEVRGPVMLERRPYEVKEVKTVPIITEELYSKFDCRKAPYPDRHYADPGAECAVFHFCHSDGKQDTFYCPQGTIFNEYLGTCDYRSSVYCNGNGQGFKGSLPKGHYHQQRPRLQEGFQDKQFGNDKSRHAPFAKRPLPSDQLRPGHVDHRLRDRTENDSFPHFHDQASSSPFGDDFWQRARTEEKRY